MIFSDRTIREAIESGSIQIEPFEPAYVQPSSVDLRVGNGFRVFVNHRYSQIDPRDPQPDLTQLVEVDEGEPFMLHPGEFVLGSTLERVKLGNDVVARLEGKSSLGRLGLLIHSSLPGSEPVLIREPDGHIGWMPIEDIVRKELAGDVLSFDPSTLAVGFHAITNWYEGPEDRIFEVLLDSGSRVRVTAGHNLFTLDTDGRVLKVRTGDLRPDISVAVPGDFSSELEMGASELAWERVVEIRDTGEVETIYDLEVRPGGRKIENFLAGSGGVFVSNTAGFVDPGFEGHITLELSNVATLPIAIYPGMKIGQISFYQMTTEADVPYGSPQLGSKYQGQSGPTASRSHKDFSN